MSERLDFFKSLLPFLNSNTAYAIFCYKSGFKSFGENDSLDILLNAGSVKPALNKMKELTVVKDICLTSHFSLSKALIRFNSGESLLLNFIHQFVYKTLYYLNTEEVLKKSIGSMAGNYTQPSIEHAFEFSVLTSYLNGRGWSEDHYRYFDDFHFLVKEDLMDFFNKKYHTCFRELDDIMDFSEEQRERMLNSLRRFPANAFLGTINIRWNNLIHSGSRASML